MARTKAFDKEQVLEKAKLLFWRKGFHATSIQDLVDHLGINRASIYDTYGGKNELYTLAFKSYQQQQSNYIEERLAQFNSPKEGISKFLKEAVESTLKDQEKKGCFVVNCTTEYLPHYPEFLPALLENKENFIRLFTSKINEGQKRGEINKKHKAKYIANFIYTYLSGLRVVSKVDQDKEEMKNSIKIILNYLDA